MDRLSKISIYLPHSVHFMAGGNVWLLTGIDTLSGKPIIASYKKTNVKSKINLLNLPKGKIMESFRVESIRLLLHPLDNIFEEVKLFGEPIHWDVYFDSDEINTLARYSSDLKLAKTARSKEKPNILEYINKSVENKLVKLHFDVFGMIDSYQAWAYNDDMVYTRRVKKRDRTS